MFMNYVYPAIFYPETDGKYSVIFPDLNDLATYGNNLADAFVMAQEACGQYLFTSLKDGESLPNPTTINAVKSDDPTAFINLICVNLDNANVTVSQSHRVFTVVHFLQIFYAVIFFTNAEFLGPGHVVGPGDSAFL